MTKVYSYRYNIFAPPVATLAPNEGEEGQIAAMRKLSIRAPNPVLLFLCLSKYDIPVTKEKERNIPKKRIAQKSFILAPVFLPCFPRGIGFVISSCSQERGLENYVKKDSGLKKQAGPVSREKKERKKKMSVITISLCASPHPRKKKREIENAHSSMTTP